MRRKLLVSFFVALMLLPAYSLILRTSLGFAALSNSLNFYVKNVNGNYVTDEKGIVKRYDSNWNFLDQMATDASGKATWADIPTGTYNFETYYNGPGGMEYWGDVEVVVSAGSNTYTFTRFMPFCVTVWVGDTGGTARTTFTAGETVRAKLTIKNNGYWSLKVKARALWDRDQIMPYDFDQTTDLSPISGSGGTTVLTLDFTIPEATSPCTMRLAYWISTELLNTNIIVTDSWFWTIHTITVERSGPPPEKSFVVLQFDTESDDEDMTNGYVSQDTLNIIHNIGELLKNYNLSATFFVQGACFNNEVSGSQFTNEIEQLAQRNEIGTQFYSHLEHMSTMPADQIAKELEGTEKAAKIKLYGSRVPYFDYSETIFNQLISEGYIYDSSVWSGGDNTPYTIPIGSKTLYELPWRCSDHNTQYNVIKGVLDNYVSDKLNMTLVLHPQFIAEDWVGFSQLIQAIANYRDSNEILVMTSMQAINYIFGHVKPDIAISTVDIRFAPSTPITNGTAVTIGIAVHNIGGTSAQDFAIRFYDGDPGNGGVQIGTDVQIERIDPSLITVINTTWVAVEGTHDIYIVADPANSISEEDESNNVAHGQILVYSQLLVSIAPTLVLMNVGQSQTFTSTVSGGLMPYSYQWYVNGTPVSGANANTWLFKPSSPGVYGVHLNVTDNVGITTKSNVAVANVNPQLLVSISPPSAATNINHSITFTSLVSGGTPPYSYQWYLNETLVPSATSPNWTFTPSSAGRYFVYLNVTDNIGMLKQSVVAPVTVSPKLAVSVAPVTVVIDVGQSVTFTCSVSGGTSPYTYQWYLNGTPVSGATGYGWTFTPASTGLYMVYLNVSDNVGSMAKSNVAFVTVNPALTVSITPTSAIMDYGQSKTFISSVSGGTAPHNYQWYVNGSAAIGATNSTWIFVPSASGSYKIYLNVTDAVGFSVQSNIATLSVNPVLSAVIEGISVSATYVQRGGSVAVTAYIKNTGEEPARFYVGASIIGEGENVWKDLPGWGMSTLINPSATSTFTFNDYVIPPDAYIGYHGVFVNVWTDSSKTQQLAEKWFPDVIEVEIPFLRDLDKKIKLVFSSSESFFPVPGLYFDGDPNIANNYQNYRPSDVNAYLADRNGDGFRDAPAYIYVVEERDYYVIECWLYYAYNSKSLFNILPFDHEHDFEYVYLWVDKTTGQLKKMALNQHRWTNNYVFTSDPGTLYIAVEEGGHGMILLKGDANHDGWPDDENGDGFFDILKPDNCQVLSPELLGSFGRYSRSSTIVSLYPWEYFDGGEPVEGFGEDAILVKGANYALIDLFVILGLEEPQFYLDAVDAALNTPILLSSGQPWSLNLVVTSIPFYIQAPWTRMIFNDPEMQWSKVSFEWWSVKANVKIATFLVVNALLNNVIVKIVAGTIVSQVIMGLFDPVEVTISDSRGRTIGYKDGILVNEIPGGVIFLESTPIDIYLIVDPRDDYNYIIRSLNSGNYNMTIALTDFSGATIEFNAKLISVEENTQHKYVINWTLLTEGKNGVKLLIDQDGDGVYERSVDCGNELTGLDIAVPWWSNLWWIFPLVSIICVITVGAMYFKMRRSRKTYRIHAQKASESEECTKYLMEKQGLDEADATRYCRLLGNRWRELIDSGEDFL